MTLAWNWTDSLGLGLDLLQKKKSLQIYNLHYIALEKPCEIQVLHSQKVFVATNLLNPRD